MKQITIYSKSKSNVVGGNKNTSYNVNQSVLDVDVNLFGNQWNGKDDLTERVKATQGIFDTLIVGGKEVNGSGSTSGDYLPLSGGTLSGHLVLGDGNTTKFLKLETIRKIGSTPNSASFYTNSDGTAAFFHKTYSNTNLSGAVNDAILKFNHEGLYFAKGDNNRTTATEFKRVITEDNKITMTAVLDNGTTKTFEIYGSEV